jgi:predicted DCC family thiol-disulfide oxidoreductase YuxK
LTFGREQTKINMCEPNAPSRHGRRAGRICSFFRNRHTVTTSADSLDVIRTPVVVYDGECGFCRRSVEAIRRRDRRGVFTYVPRQTPGIEQRFPQLLEGDFNTGLRLIDTGETVHVGADAMHQIARRLPIYNWFAWLYRVPLLHGATRWVYARVAAHRMKLSQYCSAGEACPTNHMQAPPDRPGISRSSR